MRRRANDDELTRIVRLEEQVRRLQNETFGGGSGGGGSGGGFLRGWSPLSEIFNPVTGAKLTPQTGIGAQRAQAEYAWDANFLYMRGFIYFRPQGGGWADEYTGNGDIGQFKFLSSWPATPPPAFDTEPGENVHYSIAYYGGAGGPLAQLFMALAGGDGGNGRMHFTPLDSTEWPLDWTDTGYLSLDAVALRWGRRFDVP